MPGSIFGFLGGTVRLRRRLLGIYALLALINLLVWAWALASFWRFPVPLGTAILAYSLGLRHAVDADHIAAIDNVTRKLIRRGERPLSVGLYFSLGHSTIVVLASVCVALATAAFKGQLESMQAIGGVIGTLVSAAFLLAIAAVNLTIFFGVLRTFRHVRNGGAYVDEDMDLLLARGGFLARIFRPLFRMITQSWHMYPLGFLFGLGFDTATEIGLIGISAAEVSKGLPVWSILVFPALFTAGMTLVDTTDSVLMVGAYGWAFLKPIRKLYYNLTITAVSIVVALVVGGIETLGLIGSQLSLSGRFWKAIGSLNDNFGTLGYLIIGIFLVSWIISLAAYRLGGYED
ncbi:MAG TPA: HoxN/HupN/NixA family nickel/cobalt transporter [Rhodopila sp.]|jgi:high-affinity nickel-transport protein